MFCMEILSHLKLEASNFLSAYIRNKRQTIIKINIYKNFGMVGIFSVDKMSRPKFLRPN